MGVLFESILLFSLAVLIILVGLLVYYFKKRIVEVEQNNASCLEVVQDVYLQHVKLRNEFYSLVVTHQQQSHPHFEQKHEVQTENRIKIELSEDESSDDEEEEDNDSDIDDSDDSDDDDSDEADDDSDIEETSNSLNNSSDDEVVEVAPAATAGRRKGRRAVSTGVISTN